MQNKDPRSVLLKNVRLSYPHLTEPYSMDGDSSNGAYSATFLLDKKDQETVNAVQAAIFAAAADKFDDPSAELAKLKAADRIAFRDGDNKGVDGYEGCYYIPSRNKDIPLLLDDKRSPIHDGYNPFYAGCYVNARVMFWAQDNKYGKRINAILRGVMFVKHGDAFGAPPCTAEDLGDVADTGDTSEPPW